MDMISIHAPREGGDCHVPANLRGLSFDFNPRPPRGGRLGHVGVVGLEDNDFNPRPPRGGRPSSLIGRLCRSGISIHAPREGGDLQLAVWANGSPEFQSTPPARGATSPSASAPRPDRHFNPRPPRGGRQLSVYPVQTPHQISIHAPREGGDPTPMLILHAPAVFQSTPPARGATRTGGYFRSFVRHFNPRPPRGGRRLPHRTTIPSWPFQSTPPARGATGFTANEGYDVDYFNPRPPRGGRR